MKPIAFSKKLADRAKKSTTVLIHDAHREVEKAYCERFFGRKCEMVDKLRKYEVK